MKTVIGAVMSCLLLVAEGGIAPDRARRQVISNYDPMATRYTQQMQASRLPGVQQVQPQRFPQQQFQPTGSRGNVVGAPPFYNDNSQHYGVIDVDSPPYSSSGAAYPQYHNDGSQHIGYIDVDGPMGGGAPYTPPNMGAYPGTFPNSGLNSNNFRGTFYPRFYPG